MTGLGWKTRPHELTVELDLGVPEYVISCTGPAHARTFTARVSLNGEEFDPCGGRTRNKAEQAAAAMAWTMLSVRARR